tara:strand:- start:937 stop:1110 length:174 start_codon:yes stop_codon:yes gene_type:complete
MNNPIGKDPRQTHFRISLAKSALRIAGCVLGIAFSSLTILAVFLMVAEGLGIAEEIF